MKKLILMTFMMMMVVTSLASGRVSAAAVESTEISCLLNKSFSLIVQIEDGVSGAPRVILSEKNFLQREGDVFAILNRPTVIRYGNVLMISQDYGRDGYAFLRFEKADGGSLNGWVDLNLFTNTGMTGARGYLAQLPCHGDF